MRTRTFLRMLGDVFPRSSINTRRLDHDHPTPYQSNGPPSQTSDGYALRQLDISAYRWTTPHGLGRLVTPTGTRAFTPLGSTGELYTR